MSSFYRSLSWIEYAAGVDRCEPGAQRIPACSNEGAKSGKADMRDRVALLCRAHAVIYPADLTVTADL